MQDFTERNTKNTQHSTGPTNQEGRDGAGENSRRNGLYGRIPRLPDDQIEACATHKEPLMTTLKPEDAL